MAQTLYSRLILTISLSMPLAIAEGFAASEKKTATKSEEKAEGNSESEKKPSSKSESNIETDKKDAAKAEGNAASEKRSSGKSEGNSAPEKKAGGKPEGNSNSDKKSSGKSEGKGNPEKSNSGRSDASESNSSEGSSGDKKSNSNFNEDYRKALGLIKDGKMKEAFAILKGMAGEESERSRANLLIGSMYYQKKKYKKAKRYFDEAGDDIILTKETAYAYGGTYLEYEDLSRALKGLRASLKLKSGNATGARYKLGVTYFKLGQYSRAEKFFERIDPKSLTTSLRVERQRYLLDIRARHDELMSSFAGSQDENVRTVSGSPRAFESDANDADWSKVAKEKEWGIRWKPGFMLHQENNQSLNKSNGRDSAEVLSHRVGVRAYMSGDSSEKMFGSLEYGLGFTGFDVDREQSRSFVLAGATGEFLSQSKSAESEENVFLNFQPLMNFELSPAIRMEAGGGLTAFLPKGKVSEGWGQSEVLVRVRGEGEDFDAGLEAAFQQAFDSDKNEKTGDFLVKGDINQSLGEMTLRANFQHWQVGNDKFTFFTRERMSLTDSRFKYHNGILSESKASVSGSLSIGDLWLRAIYEFTSRDVPDRLGRLNPIDDVETIAKQANKRMFSLAFPVWDTVSISAAFGSQRLAQYTYTERDPVTQAVVREINTDVTQQLFQFGCAISLIDWVKVRLTYSQGQNAYSGAASGDNAFQASNPKASENSLMHVELSKSF